MQCNHLRRMSFYESLRYITGFITELLHDSFHSQHYSWL
uniref:Uncharacterized protein n=1 Tax=Anguilla anguilla TaxID=7936 RepID=A0A0E9PNE5_ANGAN